MPDRGGSIPRLNQDEWAVVRTACDLMKGSDVKRLEDYAWAINEYPPDGWMRPGRIVYAMMGKEVSDITDGETRLAKRLLDDIARSKIRTSSGDDFLILDVRMGALHDRA